MIDPLVKCHLSDKSPSFWPLAPELMRPAPVRVTFGPGVRAVQSKPTPHLSLKGVIGAGHCAEWNDAEPVYCADNRPPCGYTLAPKGKGERGQAHSRGLGPFHPETTTSPKGKTE